MYNVSCKIDVFHWIWIDYTEWLNCCEYSLFIYDIIHFCPFTTNALQQIHPLAPQEFRSGIWRRSPLKFQSVWSLPDSRRYPQTLRRLSLPSLPSWLSLSLSFVCNGYIYTYSSRTWNKFHVASYFDCSGLFSERKLNSWWRDEGVIVINRGARVRSNVWRRGRCGPFGSGYMRRSFVGCGQASAPPECPRSPQPSPPPLGLPMMTPCWKHILYAGPTVRELSGASSSSDVCRRPR